MRGEFFALAAEASVDTLPLAGRDQGGGLTRISGLPAPPPNLPRQGEVPPGAREEVAVNRTKKGPLIERAFVIPVPGPLSRQRKTLLR